GKWTEARRPAPERPADPTARPGAEALAALPYLQGYRPARPGAAMVTVHRPDAVSPGLNLYTSGHASEAVLIDPEGRVVHRWSYPLRRLRPELYADPATRDQVRRLEYFRRARLLPEGELLAIFEGLGLVKLDAESNLLWAYRGGAHHDLDLAEDGTIYLLDREGREIPRLGRSGGVLEDLVTVLSPAGEVVRRISVLEAFERSAWAPLLARMPAAPDILHTNTLEILDGRLAGRHPAFRRGNLLLSVLELDTVAVLDPRSGEIVWALSGLWRKQHQPTVVGDGHLLVFDNLGAGRDRSRVLELDLFSRKVVWRYGGDPATDLFSKTLGSCQRLPNGNTLITESENGRALEVTPEGELVWEFVSPHRAGERGELVAALFELERLPPDFPFPGR
ncbi:MAG TPA: arylsulfotransferase family protein, partial [Thermoanaerobaculia bacterium]|nr:arylsulfotransferase family protein [Thermoanaerobaculia bacterium]